MLQWQPPCLRCHCFLPCWQSRSHCRRYLTSDSRCPWPCPVSPRSACRPALRCPNCAYPWLFSKLPSSLLTSQLALDTYSPPPKGSIRSHSRSQHSNLRWYALCSNHAANNLCQTQTIFPWGRLRPVQVFTLNRVQWTLLHHLTKWVPRSTCQTLSLRVLVSVVHSWAYSTQPEIYI